MPSIRSRWLIRSSVSLTMVSVALAAGCDAGRPRSNLLVITLDTLRADRLGCYGYEGATSPALDELASRSVVFDRAIAQAAITPVSHASIFTGLNPQHHGLRSLHGGVGYALSEVQWTLAELLRDAGYSTGGFVAAFPVTRHFGLHQGFDTWDQDFTSNEDSGLVTPRGIVNTGDAQRQANDTTDRALDWLRRQRDGPFFAWIHYFDAHDNVLRPPEEYRARFAPRSARRPDILRAIYDAQIAFIDAQISRLLAELRESGMAEETIVVVVADHGEGLGDHGWWGHVILYQEQVRVPLILHGPGLPAGHRVQEMVRSIDLVPTLVELLQVPLTDGVVFDGQSLLDLMGDGQGGPRLAYSETINDLAGYYRIRDRDAAIYALNDGRFKLLAYRKAGSYVRFELYDLDRDPTELRDLHREFPEHVERLRSILEGMQVFVDDPPQPELSEAIRSRLRSLGYLR